MINTFKDDNFIKSHKDTPNPPRSKSEEFILENYEINDAQDVQDAVKQVFAPIFEAMFNGEPETYLGRKNDECPKTSKKAAMATTP